MAMLAEPKQKLRWSLNPRGNLWANDGNKFGQKMLERMGWSKGKGLGKNENGIIEHVKVTQKNDLKGIGWNDSDGNWIAHQDEFNTILTNLNESRPQETLVTENFGSYSDSGTGTEVSMEKRSKNFKTRIHYQKFLQAKDVKKYSKQDMDSIFGGKFCAGNSEPQESEDEIVSFKSENESTDTDDCVVFHGVNMHKSTTSISDYFAQKMKQKKVHQNTAHESSSYSTIDSQQEGYCKEEILPRNTDEVSTFPVMMAENMKKRSKKTVQDPFSAFKNFGNASSITANPPIIKEPSPRMPPKKRLFSEIELGEKVYTKHLKKYPEQHVTVSPQRVLKSCLRNISADSSSVNTKKGVRFRDEQLVSYAENAVITTESTDSEHSTLNISSEHHTSILNIDSHLANYALSDKCDEKMSVIHSNTELTDSMEPCQKLEIPSNNETWDVSEKLAKKLKHYKKVSKRIREHDVFSTTNLLEIKGYGNW